MTVTAPRVLFYQRRPRPTGNFSLEAIFDDVRQRLANDMAADVRIAPFYSNGVFRRLWIAIDAWWHQSHLTHVTGDIHFAAVLLKHKNCILTVLDCGDLTERSDWKRQIMKFLWFDLPVRRAVHVTTISEAAKRDIVKLTGCPEDKITVIPVAISERFKRVDHAFNVACPRILQVGCAGNKNIERVASALAGMSCKLCILGQPSESQLSALSDAKINFEFFPRLSDEEVVDQYVRSDFVVFASTYEGFGMPIIEAQSVGRAVVTSNCSSMPEVAGDGACFVDPLDIASIRRGIERVIHEREYRESLIQKGHANAQRFDAEAISRQYLSVYRHALNLDSKTDRASTVATNQESFQTTASKRVA